MQLTHELIDPSNLKDEQIKEFLDEGYLVEQFIDGVRFLKLTTKYYEQLGEYFVQRPREFCLDYWCRLVEETNGCGIMEFIRAFLEMHFFIKNITEGKVDFCEVILGEIK